MLIWTPLTARSLWDGWGDDLTWTEAQFSTEIDEKLIKWKEEMTSSIKKRDYRNAVVSRYKDDDYIVLC